MSTPLKSQFELTMGKLQREGKVIVYSVEGSMSIIEDENSGTDEFLYEQKNNDKASEMELQGNTLNV